MFSAELGDPPLESTTTASALLLVETLLRARPNLLSLVTRAYIRGFTLPASVITDTFGVTRYFASIA